MPNLTHPFPPLSFLCDVCLPLVIRENISLLSTTITLTAQEIIAIEALEGREMEADERRNGEL